MGWGNRFVVFTRSWRRWVVCHVMLDFAGCVKRRLRSASLLNLEIYSLIAPGTAVYNPKTNKYIKWIYYLILTGA